MRAILVGAVESTQIALAAFARSPDCELALVLTLPPEKASRHSDFVDLSEEASAAGVRLEAVENINRPEAIELIRKADADYMFVIGWSQICGPEVMNSLPDRVIGYHPAALPRMRGRAAIPWTILQREPITAGTLFWIDEGVDSGPILDQEYFHVAPDETAASLYDHHMQALEAMLHRTLPQMAAGRARRSIQDERYTTWAAKRTAEDGRIDWTLPAHEIDRLVRAVGRPYPGAFSEYKGERLVIWESREARMDSHYAALPGQIIKRTSDGPQFTVMCGENTALEVLDWDCEGADRLLLHGRLGATA